MSQEIHEPLDFEPEFGHLDLKC